MFIKKVYNFFNVCKKFIPALLCLIARNWKLFKGFSTLEWVRKLKYITAIRPQKLQLHTTIWMKLRSIMLGKSNTYFMIPFIKNSEIKPG